MQNKAIILLIVLGLAVLTIANSMFIVREDQTAIRFRFGEIVQADYESGLHFKLPFVNTVTKFDARIQVLDTEPERFLTAEKKNLLVDSFVKWRINDAATFYTAVAGSVFRANQRLDQVVKNNMRSQFSRREVFDVVSGDRNQVMQILTLSAREEAQRFGIEVLDVRIRRIDLPDEVSESVFARMRAERERVARDFRARGREEAERIRADADRQRTILLAEAFRDAETMRGEGDARSAEIYATAFNRDPDFFSLYRSFNAYRTCFASHEDIMVLQPNSDFFRFFHGPDGRPANAD
jgi:membrane protease subunit HflC